jgi:hypothetical protein
LGDPKACSEHLPGFSEEKINKLKEITDLISYAGDFNKRLLSEQENPEVRLVKGMQEVMVGNK